MIFSQPHNEVVTAMTIALAEMDEMTKTQTARIPTKSGGNYSYTYVDLAQVMAYVRPLLAKHNLVVSQETITAEGGTAVSTVLLHNSGQWVATGPLKLPSSSDAQSHGSAITYARRYSLMALLGLATEDDDGQAASLAVGQGASTRSAAASRDGDPSSGVPSGDGSAVDVEFAALTGKQKVTVQQKAKDLGILNVRAAEHAPKVLELITEVKEAT